MWKDWLTYSRSERYGLFVLALFITFLAFFPSLYDTFFFESVSVSNNADFEKVDSFFRALKYSPPKAKKQFDFANEEKPTHNMADPSVFDPNTISLEQLEALGFSNKQAKVIENYRNRGGVFKSPSDFAKIYVVDSAMFERLSSYIKIDTLNFLKAKESNAEVSQSIANIIIELNSTDSLELVKLKGIGTGFARRIIAYRQLLGGYNNVDQLKEIWGFTPDMLESLRQNLTVDTINIQKINLNIVSYQDLRKHPYITDYQAKAIIYYRETKGNFNNVDEVILNKLIDKNTFSKMKAYFTIN